MGPDGGTVVSEGVTGVEAGATIVSWGIEANTRPVVRNIVRSTKRRCRFSGEGILGHRLSSAYQCNFH
ncbi:MAG: hypothetical protein NWE91_09020 [Candidatus Bathyarchaeota archaeon]|nr:hypothetical protein [Candidatus Bathyarchaeota archaeon]